MALADDGLVEAVYMPDHSYVWAIQWHPEFSLKDETSKKFFSSFVKLKVPENAVVQQEDLSAGYAMLRVKMMTAANS